MRFHYNFSPCMIDLTNTMVDKRSCCYVIAIDAVNIAEFACSKFTCHALVANKVMLSEAVLCHSDYRSGINGVIRCSLELQYKPNEEQTYLFC